LGKKYDREILFAGSGSHLRFSSGSFNLCWVRLNRFLGHPGDSLDIVFAGLYREDMTFPDTILVDGGQNSLGSCITAQANDKLTQGGEAQTLTLILHLHSLLYPPDDHSTLLPLALKLKGNKGCAGTGQNQD
jgi:hypothetical protein